MNLGGNPVKQIDAGFGKKLTRTLTPLFGQPPNFISDSKSVIDQLRGAGCLAFTFTQGESMPPKYKKNVVMVATNSNSIPSYSKLHAFFRNSRVLMIPLLSFDPSMEATIYTFELIALSDFGEAVKANERWLTHLLDPGNLLNLRGNNCNLVCEIQEGVYVMRPKTEVALLPGEWDSIGSYFEVGMVPPPDSFRPGFIINGVLSVPGVAVAHHRQMNDGLQNLPELAWSLFKDLQEKNNFPVTLEIQDSRIVKALAGKADILSELSNLTNAERELILTEMAFSTNTSLSSKQINWAMNSQMNEGVVGIHVGIGDGLTGAHIDFICPGVDLITSATDAGSS